MKNSKLFPNSERQRKLERDKRQAREILNQMERLTQNANDQTLRQLEAKANELNRVIGSGTNLGFTREMIRSIRQITKGVSERPANAISRFLSGLGVSGANIARWFRSYEGQELLKPIQSQVRQALDLVNQIDPDGIGLGEITPEQAGGQRIPTPPDVPVPGSDNGGRSRLPKPAPQVADDDDDSIHRNVTVLPDGSWRIRGPGYDRALWPDDDALTGRMRPVRSSNVHSIGYMFNLDYPLKGKLVVRYLQKDRSGKTSGKVGGPTYAYDNVHPDLFQDLARAGSKGKWVWDELRIRGTIAGHQFSYNLIRAAQDYLPRRALVRNGRQILQRRRRTAERRDGSRYNLTSPLPTRIVGPYRPTAKRPNVGNPDRGRANGRR